MTTLSKEIEIIDENGIWQLIKEGDRYAVRTCHVYEDYEEYDTYRLPNHLGEAVFANYVEPASCSLKTIKDIFWSRFAAKSLPLAAMERLSLITLSAMDEEDLEWDKLMKEDPTYPHLAGRGLIYRSPSSKAELTIVGGCSMIFLDLLLKVADQ